MTDKFKIGDKVRVVDYISFWTRGHFPDNTILTVGEDDDCTESYIDRDKLTIEVTGVNANHDDFELVVDTHGEAGKEAIMPFTAQQYSGFPPAGMITLEQTVRAEPAREPVVESPSIGVYRPNLEDRKVGKVPMHMVTDGFPNALRHVAEIMGWAAVTKGYKLHDWKNLPDAEVAFPDAADRHGNDNSIQKAEGLSALNRVDHESAKLHIGHKVFNLLAELELVLTGKIK